MTTTSATEDLPNRKWVPVRHLFYVFSLALLLRLALLILMTWDEHVIDSYDRIAIHLLRENVFSFDGRNPTITRGPAYPGYLAAIMLIFGDKPVPYTFIRVVDIILDSLTAVGVIWLCSIFFPRSSPRVRLWAGGLYALNPFLAYYTLKLGPEIFTTFFLMLYLGLLGRLFFRQKRSLGNTLSLGIVSGILILSKCIFIPFVILAPLLIFMLQPNSRKLSTAAPVAVTWVLALIILLPWSWRCSRAAGEFVLVQTLTGFNFWYDLVIDENRNENFAAGAWNKSIIEEGQVMLAQGTPYRPYATHAREDIKYNRELTDRAIKWIVQNPLKFMTKIVDNLLAFWYLVETPKKMIITGLFSLVFILLALRGAHLASITGGKVESLFLLLLVGIMDLIYSPVISMFRYSLNVYPLLSILAGWAVWDLVRCLKLKVLGKTSR